MAPANVDALTGAVAVGESEPWHRGVMDMGLETILAAVIIWAALAYMARQDARA